ncbi:MAG: hypothetical protein HXS48_21135 [Theionarchaea archaeon]|nr:MAG: hypothetical protein AYK19_03010 [Theionarchaea archaeon DG-70-1]MBU7029453.1 hypothetical protein [Theionarchaea archaeon]
MILIVDMNYKGSLGFYEFVLPLCRIVEPLEYEVWHYTEVKDIEYQEVILSGTALKDTGYLRNMGLFEWIRECDVPILGICAGLQVIGLVFDSLLILCQEIGMTEIEPVKENPLFSSPLTVYELHNYGIDPSDEFEILTTSEKCIQGVKHKKKEIYGVLFHPEVRNKDIVKRFVQE